MCNRMMLAGSDKNFSGPYSPHGKIDDGGVLMKEIMAEFELRAANTHFKPTKSAARNTGTATYCRDKSYIHQQTPRNELAPHCNELSSSQRSAVYCRNGIDIRQANAALNETLSRSGTSLHLTATN